MSADVAGLSRALSQLGAREDRPFANPELVAEALTHSSFATEKGGRHNERLEMLGDAVVGFLVTDLLFDLLPDAAEGVLTRVRASLVDERSLAARARRIELGRALAVGRGEERTGGRNRDSLLADAFEAMVAALYRSEGLEMVRALTRALFADEVNERAERGLPANDFKTTLQHRAHAELKLMPGYTIVATAGPDHERVFTAEVRVGDDIVGRGEGRSKKLAEQQAARAALEIVEADLMEPLFATFHTPLGRLVVRLFEDETPNTVRHFVGLATGELAWTHPKTGEKMSGAPLYDGTLIHRVEPTFMVQLGDPFSRDDGDIARVGTGGPGFTVADEIRRDLRFDRPGRVAMAGLRRPDTNGSQLFITEVAAPHLNFRHTIFGEVEKGFEKVPKLTRVKADETARPLEPLRVERVVVSRGRY